MILNPSWENIQRAAKTLREGRLVAFPTETVYGLGADATNEAAVRQIYQAKKRPSSDPLIVHLSDMSQIGNFAEIYSQARLADTVEKLSQLWPGPLTVILPLKGELAPSVTAGKQTVGIRIPSHPVALKLIAETGKPIAAPSANQFSYVSPTCAEHVEKSLGDEIDMILDGGKCKVGIESTILSLVEEKPVLLRPGIITRADIEKYIGPIDVKQSFLSEEQIEECLAPGMLKKHYSPNTKLVIRGQLPTEYYAENVGLIRFSPETETSDFNYRAVSTLSHTKDLNAVASNLYDAIREFDNLNLDLIVVDSCTEQGAGAAIMDRVKRAAH